MVKIIQSIYCSKYSYYNMVRSLHFKQPSLHLYGTLAPTVCLIASILDLVKCHKKGFCGKDSIISHCLRDNSLCNGASLCPWVNHYIPSVSYIMYRCIVMSEECCKITSLKLQTLQKLQPNNFPFWDSLLIVLCVLMCRSWTTTFSILFQLPSYLNRNMLAGPSLFLYYPISAWNQFWQIFDWKILRKKK